MLEIIVADAEPSLMSGVSEVTYRVPFYDTDAMGVVHHSNYARYFELVRVQFLEDYDTPYLDYVEDGIQVAVTLLQTCFKRPCRFNDLLCIQGRLEWVKVVSMRFSYVISCGGEIKATGATEHAFLDLQGRPMRIPKQRRGRLVALCPARL